MAIAVYTSFQQVSDDAGDPLNGGSVTVYQAGTTTPIQLYNDDDLAGGHETTNPITLDAYGRHAITYFSTQSYKVLVKNSGGSTIYTRDNIDPGVPVGTGALPVANGGTGATSATLALSNLGGATAAELADVAADVAALAGAASSTEKTHIATGTTAQRPAVPVEGDIRRNTTTSRFEFYDSDWRNVMLATQAATAAEQETGTSTTVFVSPGVQHRHQSAAKAWLTCDAAGNLSTPSYNITSITDTNTGIVDITIATDFSGGTYTAVASSRNTGNIMVNFSPSTGVAAGTGRLLGINASSAAATDTTAYDVVFFGDQ
jgi:hypothetical protein